MTELPLPHAAQEWLETDGLGGFASGPIHGARSRRYHALLIASSEGTRDRRALVPGMDEWLAGFGRTLPLSTQAWRGGLRHPDAESAWRGFSASPWPTFRYEPAPGLEVRREIFMVQGAAATVLRWTARPAPEEAQLHVRPFLSGRSYHALEHEGGDFDLHGEPAGRGHRFRLRPGAPDLLVLHDGSFLQESHWYRGFHYQEEEERGYGAHEDLAAPGVFALPLIGGEAAIILVRADHRDRLDIGGMPILEAVGRLAAREEARRSALGGLLERGADAYIVATPRGKSIVAGYPWFTDWGRDTFLALRGLTLATGRCEDAASILTAWAEAREDGMIPNRFADEDGAAEFNSVDASLWFVVAAHAWREETRRRGQADDATWALLRAAARDVLVSYQRGTRYGIGCAPDGLLRAGEPGLQLTWMDARVGDEVITPRIGKPVEVQALWINALRLCGNEDHALRNLCQRALASFRLRFPAERGLHDVVDVDGRDGADDPALRPNQIFAIGGLPHPLLRGEAARSVVRTVEEELLTPAGLRSLAPSDPRYRGTYVGDAAQRDQAYHQGTVWPYLLGPFVEAWLRVRGSTREAREEARRRFVEPVRIWMELSGIPHLPELADGDPPHWMRGAPFQAWSVAEILRLDRMVLAEPAVACPT
jgi:predicted glycogen debranching enzyme